MTVAVEVLEGSTCFGEGVVAEVIPVGGGVVGGCAVFPVGVGGTALGEVQGNGGGTALADLGDVKGKESDREVDVSGGVIGGGVGDRLNVA